MSAGDFVIAAVERVFVVAGAVSAGLAVALGAFGAHALRSRLSLDQLAIYETASRYHLIHSIAVIIAAWAVSRWPGQSAVASGWLFLAGIVLFSGSLYALTLCGVKAFGAVTPLGGVAFIAGWLLLAAAAFRG